MKLPFIRAGNLMRRGITAFGGLNRSENFMQGELCDCSGVSHLEFPFLTQKRKWERMGSFENPGGIVHSGGEAVVDGESFYFNNEKKGTVSPGEKQLVPIGDYIIILPDKKYYNVSTDKFGDMDAAYTYNDLKITFTENSIILPDVMYTTLYATQKLNCSTGETMLAYESITVNKDVFSLGESKRKSPDALVQGEIFFRECSENQYRVFISTVFDEEKGVYVVENELVTVVKSQPPLPEEFRYGDAVEISGCVSESTNNGMFIVKNVNGRTIEFESNVFTACEETESITLRRNIPDFSCACAYENRLWGCCGKTIYGSKLGDPFNFHVYRGISTDSFTVESNDTDNFTACISYGNCCLFFKENSAYKLFGKKPSNFQLTKTVCPGIPEECRKSLAENGGKVFFAGKTGVYVYGGGSARLISGKLGNINFSDAAAGTDGRCYFLAAGSDDGVRRMYVFDYEKGLWSIEGETTAFGFSFFNERVHKLCSDGIYCAQSCPDDEAQWTVTLHPFNENHFRKKSYNRIYVCAELWNNAWMQIEVSYDKKPFFIASTVYGDEKKHLSIPLRTGGCNEIVIRISGKGRCRLESLVREFAIN